EQWQSVEMVPNLHRPLPLPKPGEIPNWHRTILQPYGCQEELSTWLKPELFSWPRHFFDSSAARVPKRDILTPDRRLYDRPIASPVTAGSGCRDRRLHRSWSVCRS